MTCKKDPDDDDPQSQNQSGAGAPVPLLTCAPVQLSMQTCAPSGIRLGQAQVFVRKACVCVVVGWGGVLEAAEQTCLLNQAKGAIFAC